MFGLPYFGDLIMSEKFMSCIGIELSLPVEEVVCWWRCCCCVTMDVAGLSCFFVVSHVIGHISYLTFVPLCSG